MEITRDFGSIAQHEYDLVVIGGGINGAGIFRDACVNGLRALLLEKGDFARGTSSGSTKLIHGGLRYLEYLEFGLVRESLREREILLHTAGHLVHPLRLLFPIYRGRRHGALEVGLGMILYDVLSLGKSLPHHRWLAPERAQLEHGALRREGLRFAFEYADCQVPYPERLVLENVLDGVARGGKAVNYAEVTGFDVTGGRVRAVEVKDVLTGHTAVVSGRLFVNASGPWVDRVLGLAGVDGPRRIGGTRGTHIVLRPEGPLPEQAVYAPAVSDGRPFFTIPWEGFWLIGTTDIRTDESPDSVHATREEVDYLLTEANQLLDTVGLDRSHLVYTYAGIRPLPYTKAKREGAVTRKAIVLRHSRKEPPEGLISVIGGKLTTYRNLGRKVVRLACKTLGRKCQTETASLRLPGAGEVDRNAWERLVEELGVTPASQGHLLSLYGSRAVEILRFARDKGVGAELLVEGAPDLTAEVLFAAEQEGAWRTEDVMLRRTGLALRGWFDETAARQVAQVLGQVHRRSTDEVEQDAQAFVELFRQRYQAGL